MENDITLEGLSGCDLFYFGGRAHHLFRAKRGKSISENGTNHQVLGALKNWRMRSASEDVKAIAVKMRDRHGFQA